jgi:O-antigen/teichoic acid export membrane protein
MKAETLRRSTGNLLAAQLGTALLAFIVEITLSRTLGPAGRGIYAEVLVASQVAAVVGASGLGYLAVRELRQGRWEDAATTSIVVGATVLTAIPVAVFAAVAVAEWVYPAAGIIVIASVFLVVIAAALVQNARLLLVARGQSRRSASLQILERGTFLVALVLLFAATATVKAAVLALAVDWVLIAVVAMRLLGVRLELRYRIQMLLPALSLWRQALRVVLANVAQFTTYRLDIFLVVAWSGASAAGVYAAAVALCGILWYLPDAAASAVYPQSAEGSARAKDKTFRVTWIVLGITAFGASMLAALSPFAIPLLLGARFQSSVKPFLLLLPGVVLFSVAKTLTGLLIGLHRETLVSVLALGTALVTVAADVILIPRFGASGAAAASTLAYSGASVATLLAVRGAGVIPSSGRIPLPADR